tara:strand:+ start:2512 stop:2892 length:381 start_codon:yes stop_codon:yes gene_type:complete
MLDRPEIKNMRKELEQLLNKYSSEITKYDIELMQGGSFTETEMTFKLAMRLKGGESQLQVDLIRFSALDNVDTTKIADIRGTKYSLVGYKRSARVRPYIAQNLQDNKHYVFTEEQAKEHFGKGEVA